MDVWEMISIEGKSGKAGYMLTSGEQVALKDARDR